MSKIRVSIIFVLLFFLYFPITLNGNAEVEIPKRKTETPTQPNAVVPMFTPTFTETPLIQLPAAYATPTRTPTPTLVPHRLKYYAMDRVQNNSNLLQTLIQLQSWGVNTVIANFHVGPQPDSPAVWDRLVGAVAALNMQVVIWPDGHQGSDVAGCRWESPFDDASRNNNPDLIVNIRPILMRYFNNPAVVGIVIGHEPVWVDPANQDRCSETIADMTEIKRLIHEYVDPRRETYTSFGVWNYINNLNYMSNLIDYSAPNRAVQTAGIQDVAVIWYHCAGNAEGPCKGGTYSALGQILSNEYYLANSGLSNTVELMFLMQTFTASGGYETKFTLSQLEQYSCDFLNTGGLDGFGYYTWDAGWWPDLHAWPELQPAINYVKNLSSCAR